MAAELQAYDRSHLKYVNQSLFACRNLLDYGFHLVNKPVLFELAENQCQRMVVAELARWLPSGGYDLLPRDIEQLLISRYCGGTSSRG